MTDKYILLEAAFTPATPIQKKDLFSGRSNEIKLVVEAIIEQGRHAVIHGERGVGKTSLANIIEEILEKPCIVAKISCESTDNYTTIWQKALNRVTLHYEQKESLHEKVNLGERIQEEKTINVGDVTRILKETEIEEPLVFILDEFDRVKDTTTKTVLADTVKSFSDYIPSTTLIFVGVADSVNQLIGEHPSIERNLKQILVPRMSPTELHEIISKGLSLISMSIDNKVKERIIKFSQGFPHYTHLLAKHSARQALKDNRDNIIEADFKQAIEDAVNDVQESIREAYYKATAVSKKKTIFPEVLRACALAQVDDKGAFRPVDVEGPLSKILNKDYRSGYFASNLSKLCTPERGPILEKLDPGTKYRPRYRFINPLTKSFILLHALRSGSLDPETIDQIL